MVGPVWGHPRLSPTSCIASVLILNTQLPSHISKSSPHFIWNRNHAILACTAPMKLLWVSPFYLKIRRGHKFLYFARWLTIVASLPSLTLQNQTYPAASHWTPSNIIKSVIKLIHGWLSGVKATPTVSSLHIFFYLVKYIIFRKFWGGDNKNEMNIGVNYFHRRPFSTSIILLW